MMTLYFDFNTITLFFTYESNPYITRDSLGPVGSSSDPVYNPNQPSTSLRRPEGHGVEDHCPAPSGNAQRNTTTARDGP